MHTVFNGLIDPATIFALAASGSVWGTLQRIWFRLADLFQSWVAKFNVPLLKYYSLLIETKLRQAGQQLLGEHLTWVVLVISLAAGIPALLLVWRVLGSGQRVHKASYRKIDKNSEPLGASLHAATGSYFKSAVDLAFEGILLVGAAAVLSVVAYLLCKLSWYSYLVTPVGQLYPYYFPERARIMNAVLGQDIFLFPMVLTGIALLMGLLAGAVCRLLHITRYGYTSQSLLGRIVLFALPLTAAAAVFTQAAFAIPHWGAAYGATLLPTLLVFPFCFKSTGFLLPELGMVSSLWKHDRTPPPQVLFLLNRNAKGKTLEFDPLQARLTGRRFPADGDAAIQGQFVTRRGHQYLLYRYGHELYFQVDDRELQLGRQMAAQLKPRGRLGCRFELTLGETCLFRLCWSELPLIGAGKAVTAFFEAFAAILKDRATFEQAYTDQWDWEAEE